MRCPGCSSPNVRLQEFGALLNSYVCNQVACQKVFDRPTPASRFALLSLLLGGATEVIGTVGALVAELFDDSGGGA